MSLETKDWIEVILAVVAATAFVVTSKVWLSALRESIDRLSEAVDNLREKLEDHGGRITGLEWFTGMRKPNGGTRHRPDQP